MIVYVGTESLSEFRFYSKGDAIQVDRMAINSVRWVPFVTTTEPFDIVPGEHVVFTDADGRFIARTGIVTAVRMSSANPLDNPPSV